MRRNFRDYFRPLLNSLGVKNLRRRAKVAPQRSEKPRLEGLECRINPATLDLSTIEIGLTAPFVVNFQLDATGSNLLVNVNGSALPANNASFSVATTPFLNVEGTTVAGDNESLVVQDNASGQLPGQSGGFNQAAAPGHTNQAYANSSFATLPLGINYNGHGAADTISVQLTQSVTHSMGYFPDVTSDGLIGLAGSSGLSFTGVSSVTFAGAAGVVTADASSVSGLTDLTIAKPAGSLAGVSALTSTSAAFEPLTFSGFSSLQVFGGTGSQTITLSNIDASAPASPGQALTSITLSGDNSAGTDTFANTIEVDTLPAGLTGVQLVGAAGNDIFNIGNGDLSGIQSAVTVDGKSPSASTTPIAGDTLNLLDQASNGNNPAIATSYAIAPQTIGRDATTLISYQNIETLSLMAGIGPDTVAVNSTPALLNLNVTGGPNGNSFTVTNTGTGSVTSLTGGNGGDTYDVLATGGSSTLTVNGGTGGDTYTIANTGGGSTTTVKAGNGANAFNIQGTATGSNLTVTGNAGQDTFKFGNGGQLAGIAGAVTIDGVGGTSDTASFDDSTNASSSTYTITSTSFAFGPAATTVSFSNIPTVTVDGTSGGGSFSVTGTPSFLTLNGGAGNDSFIVSNTSTSASVTINENVPAAAASGNDSVTITGTGTSATVLINGGEGAEALSIQNTGTSANVTADGGTGVNTFAVVGSGTSSTISLTGGPKNDLFTIGSGTLANVKSSTISIAGGGQDATTVPTQSISNDAGSVSNNVNLVGDSLIIADQLNTIASPVFYDLTDTQVDFETSPTVVTYSSVKTLTVIGANSGDMMNVTTTPGNANVTLNGGTGENTFAVQTTGANTNLTINGNTGIDDVLIERTGASPFVVANGGAGANGFTLVGNGAGGGVSFVGGTDNDLFDIGIGSFGNLKTLLNINGGGHDATLAPAQNITNAAGSVPSNANVVGDRLNLEDGSNATAGPFTYTLAATTFKFGASATPQLGYSNIQSLVLTGATNATVGDSITVVSTPDNANITLNGGTGPIGDQIEIVNTGKNVNLTVTGNAGNDTITIDNTGVAPFVIVNGGAGLNTFNLAANGASGAVSLRGGPDNDTFNVGNGSLNSLNGLLDIQGGGQDAGTVVAQSFTNAAGTANNNLNLIGDTLNVNDGGTATATTYALTSQTLGSNSIGSGSPQLGYGGIESLTLNAAVGNDNVIVSSTPDAANVTLNGGAGQNTFTVATTGNANNLTINGNGSGDTFTIQSTGSNPYVVLQGTAGPNTFNLQADGAGTGGVQLLGGADNDQFNLGNGTLAGLLSLMDIEGGAHDATPIISLAPIVSPASATPVPANPNPVGDSLFLGDQTASGAGVYSLTANTIAFGGVTPLLGYSSVQSLTLSGANGGDTMTVTTTPANANVTLNGGTGANTYTIQTTGASTNLTINGNVGIDTITIQNTGANPFVVANGGAGANVFTLLANGSGGGISLVGGIDNDTFNVGNGTLGNLQSLLNINGGGHDATLAPSQSITNAAGSVPSNPNVIGDTLNLNDGTNATPGPFTYTLTATTFKLGASATPQLGYSNIQSLVLTGATNATVGDSITVVSTPDNANITLNGGTGPIGDQIEIVNTGKNVNLTVTGNAGNDTITIDNTGVAPFVIVNGGAGLNTFNLDANGASGGCESEGRPRQRHIQCGQW